MMTSKVGNLKILLVDAEKAFAEKFVPRFNELKDFTSSVEVCHSGAEMLERIYRQPCDLIFLDMDLPDMDAFEILSRVGQTTLPFPIVMMGRTVDARRAIEAMKRGILDYLMKDDLVQLDLGGLLQRLLDSFRLRRENAELVQINQMKDDFLATISHELRTPLTSILGLSEVLLAGRMGPLQEKQSQSLKKVLEQSQNLVKLINQLLDIRNFTQDRPKMEMKPLSLQELVGQQAAAMQSLFDKKGVKLAMKGGKEDALVEAHADNLGKVIEHIISNALKFTPRDGEVQIETKRTDSGHVQMRVSDTGRGIPAESLSYVFQRFFHVDKSLTRPYGGMGLGLAYCKEVVEAHGGRIWVESKGANLGTTVSVLLPKMRDVPVERKSAAPPKVAQKKTILWVDDNPNLLELVEYGFAGFPHPVNLLTAQGGVSALATMRSQIPDLVVLDIMMSDMDGLELLDRLRADPQTKSVPVLVVSGYQEAAKMALERGANDLSLKPFRLQDVLKKIEVLLFTPAV